MRISVLIACMLIVACSQMPPAVEQQTTQPTIPEPAAPVIESAPAIEEPAVQQPEAPEQEPDYNDLQSSDDTYTALDEAVEELE